MSLFVSSLNSGSNGNCYYIGNTEEAVLIDAGISAREIERRLKRQELSIKKVRAVLVTHEHADHIGGLRKLVKRHQLPVYMTPETRNETRLDWREILVRPFVPHEEIRIGNLSIKAFPTMHDARDSHGFAVTHKETTVAVITDLGCVTPAVFTYFEKCKAAFLESNYDEEMLRTGGYPEVLQERIRGDRGHLSNLQALECFMTHRPEFMTHLFLSHLSENNNTAEIVTKLFSAVAGETEIVIASRYKETGVYHIGGDGKLSGKVAEAQLKLF